MGSMRETNLAHVAGEHAIHGTWLSVDVVALTRDSDAVRIALITRAAEPHRGATTLPGGLLAAWNSETVEQAARRIVSEKVGVEVAGDVAILDVVSDPGRDERGHTVSIVVAARVPADTPGAVRPARVPEDMPFGHTAMIRNALGKINTALMTDPAVTYALLGESTTMAEVMALVRACEPTASQSTIGSRLRRCGLYASSAERSRKADTGAGRPALVFTRVIAADAREPTKSARVHPP